jgi:cytochrome c oxidase subunit 1
VVWYTVLPRVAGGRLFSDPLARMAFILFVLLSTPVGFHHQFADPGITAGWKLAHTILTFAVMYPSFVTAFTVIASLEIAGRLKGARGLFNWIGALPWGDPLFASVALAMIAFTFGGSDQGLGHVGKLEVAFVHLPEPRECPVHVRLPATP